MIPWPLLGWGPAVCVVSPTFAENELASYNDEERFGIICELGRPQHINNRRGCRRPIDDPVSHCCAPIHTEPKQDEGALLKGLPFCIGSPVRSLPTRQNFDVPRLVRFELRFSSKS